MPPGADQAGLPSHAAARIAGPQRKSVAAVSGASNSVIQALFAALAGRLSGEGLRVVGVIEETVPTPQNVKRRLALAEIGGSSRFPISQNLGGGSTACNLDVSGLADACGAIERSLVKQADLVIISKFGKQEASGAGLRDAFLLAIAEGIPVLTAVNPMFRPEWEQFAGELGEHLPADYDAMAAWWADLRPMRKPLADNCSAPPNAPARTQRSASQPAVPSPVPG